MEGIIAIIGIIIAIVNAINKSSKSVKKNAPGQKRPPQQVRHETVKAPIPPVQYTPPTPAQPTVMSDSDNFWKKVSDMLAEKETGSDVQGHEQVTSMPEGNSRECEHGSVGGSMAYGGHQGGRVTANIPARSKFEDSKAEDYSMYRPAMNAQEMRQAVVMAEILKRPQERMAEQARRWSVR